MRFFKNIAILSLFLNTFYSAFFFINKNENEHKILEKNKESEKLKDVNFKNPFPTLVSARAEKVEIHDRNSSFNGENGCRCFRYGVLSDGPVNIEINGGKGLLTVINIDCDLVIKKAWGNGSGLCKVSLILKAGEELRIFLDFEDSNKPFGASLILTEVNYARGLKNIDDVINRVERLISEANDEKRDGKYETARKKLKSALELFLNEKSTRQSEKAINVVWRVGFLANGLNDITTAMKAWEVVSEFQEKTLSENDLKPNRNRMNLAALLIQSGDFCKAKKLIDKTLIIYERYFSKDHAELQNARMALAISLLGLGEYKESKKLFEEIIKNYEEKPSTKKSKLCNAKMNYALSLTKVGDYSEAKKLLGEVLKYFEKTLPAEHSDIQRVRVNLADNLRKLGYLYEAKEHLEKVLEIWERTLPFDHSELLGTKINYAATICKLGYHSRAKEILESVLKIYETKFSSDHPNLLITRLNIALTLKELGDYSKAYLLLKSVLEVWEKRLPSDHIDVQYLRVNLAMILEEKGDYSEAREQFEKVLKYREKVFPQEHPDVQIIRTYLAKAYSDLGDYSKARDLLEKVLRLWENTLPQKHLEIQTARINLSSVLVKMGDHFQAYELLNKALEIYKKNYPKEHPDLQDAKKNLSVVLKQLGDFPRAKEILMEVLEVDEKRLPTGHPDFEKNLMNLGSFLMEIGEFSEARHLVEKLLKLYEKKLPKDHPDMQKAKGNMAIILMALGRYSEARNLLKEIIRVYEKKVLPENIDLQLFRLNLSIALALSGDFSSAREQLEKVIRLFNKTLSSESFVYQSSRLKQARIFLLLGEKDKCINNIRSILKSINDNLVKRIKIGAGREIDVSSERFFTIPEEIMCFCNWAELSFELFQSIEMFRTASAKAGRMRKLISWSGEEKIRKLQMDVIRGQQRVASAEEENFAEAVFEKDRLERILADEVMKLPGAKEIGSSMGVNEIVCSLREGWLGVTFVKYNNSEFEKKPAFKLLTIPSYLAFILKGKGKVERVELGPAEQIEEVADRWLYGLRNLDDSKEWKESGEKLRKLVWDPIYRGLGGCTKVIISPDAALATIPFEALPEGKGFLGEVYTIAYIDGLSTLTIKAERIPEGGGLLAFGGVDYDSKPKRFQGKIDSSGEKRFAVLAKDFFRSGPRSLEDGKVPPLMEAEREVEYLADLYRKTMKGEAIVAKGSEASKASLIALSSWARYLHIATHGFFAPERFKSVFDSKPEERIIFQKDFNKKVEGLAPLLLCGLLLAGANQEDQKDGVLTAEELTGLDLSRCELAVLSACESNVGIVRTGQGIMSLQKALWIAGVRRSITSLWKVDDEATRALFEEFYKELWKGNLNPSEALRRAKLRMIRGRIRPNGKKDKDYTHPFYWAAFVLWGDPE